MLVDALLIARHIPKKLLHGSNIIIVPFETCLH